MPGDTHRFSMPLASDGLRIRYSLARARGAFNPDDVPLVRITPVPESHILCPDLPDPAATPWRACPGCIRLLPLSN